VAQLSGRGSQGSGPHRVLVRLRGCSSTVAHRPHRFSRRYTPLKQIEGMPDALQYDPVRCKTCKAVLSPFW
jgi:hypothetical protein